MYDILIKRSCKAEKKYNHKTGVFHPNSFMGNIIYFISFLSVNYINEINYYI
jgi:hypothetical protein